MSGSHIQQPAKIAEISHSRPVSDYNAAEEGVLRSTRGDPPMQMLVLCIFIAAFYVVLGIVALWLR